MAEDSRITAALAALDRADALFKRGLAEVDAAKRALTSEEPQGVVVQRLMACFAELWKRRYGAVYQFGVAKDVAQLKRLLKTIPGEQLARSMAAYLKDGDRFLADAKHPFGLFVTGVNRYTVTTLPLERELTQTFNCSHEPPCLNDAAHTKRMMIDLRS